MSKYVNKYLAFVLLMVIIISLPVVIISAGSLTMIGTIELSDSNDPIYPHQYFDTCEFTVTQTGTYSLDVISPVVAPPYLFVSVSLIPNQTSPVLLVGTNIGIIGTGTLNLGTTYYLHPYSANGVVLELPIDYEVSISGPGDIVSNCIGSGILLDGSLHPVFTDGRINNYDVAAPVAVYPHEVNGEVGLIIYATDGTLLLVISPEQIRASPENPESNILIAEGNGVALYRITGGKWQINTRQYNGKTYVLIFEQLSSSGRYESFETN